MTKIKYHIRLILTSLIWCIALFTYEQITCELCREVGFASRNINGENWTMLVFDVLY